MAIPAIIPARIGFCRAVRQNKPPLIQGRLLLKAALGLMEKDYNRTNRG